MPSVIAGSTKVGLDHIYGLYFTSHANLLLHILAQNVKQRNFSTAFATQNIKCLCFKHILFCCNLGSMMLLAITAFNFILVGWNRKPTTKNSAKLAVIKSNVLEFPCFCTLFLQSWVPCKYFSFI